MASTSYQRLQSGEGETVLPDRTENLPRGSPVVTRIPSPRINKAEAASCSDITKLQPVPTYKKGHTRSSSSSPSLAVRFRKKKTKKVADVRPKSLLVLNTTDMRKNSNENALSLVEALHEKKLRVGFRIFLESEFSVENLDFWMAAEEYRKIANTEARKVKAMEIYEEFISPGARNQINLDHFTRNQVIQHMASDAAPGPDTFTAAQRYIFNIMENDSYVRFLRSKYYDICSSPGRRSPRRFFFDILHSGKSRDRSNSPKRSSDNNNNSNSKKLSKSDILSSAGCHITGYVN